MITFSTFKERLQHLKKNEDHRVCRPIQDGQMIIEYRGEIIWPSVSNVREKHYQSQNKHSFFFEVSDPEVIDTSPLTKAMKHSSSITRANRTALQGNCLHKFECIMHSIVVSLIKYKI